MSIFEDSSGNYGLRGVFEHIAKALFGTDSGSFKDTGIYKLFASIFRGGINAWDKYTGSGLTDAERQKLELEDMYADENATVNYMRQRELIEDYGPDWEIRQTAKGFDEVGLNRMLMGGGSYSGASATSPSMSTGGSASGLSSSNMIESLLSFGLQAKKLDIEEGHLENETKETNADVERTKSETQGIDIKNKNLQELLDLQKGELSETINFLNQQIKTEPVKRALLTAEVSYKYAQANLTQWQSAFAQAQSRYGTRYWDALVRGSELLNQAQQTSNEFQRRLLMQQYKLNTQQITSMVLNNGILGYEFLNWNKNFKFNRTIQGVNAAAGALQAIGSVAIGAYGVSALRPRTIPLTPNQMSWEQSYFGD